MLLSRNDKSAATAKTSDPVGKCNRTLAFGAISSRRHKRPDETHCIHHSLCTQLHDYHAHCNWTTAIFLYTTGLSS